MTDGSSTDSSSIDQIIHIEQPSVFIKMSQWQRRHAANTNYWYCWTGVMPNMSHCQITRSTRWFLLVVGYIAYVIYMLHMLYVLSVAIYAEVCAAVLHTEHIFHL